MSINTDMRTGKLPKLRIRIDGNEQAVHFEHERGEEVYYLAFGSNLKLGRMTKRCPSAKPVALVTIHGSELAFGSYNNVATLRSSNGGTAGGALYQLDGQDLMVLDRCEGADKKKSGNYIRIKPRHEHGEYEPIYSYLLRNGPTEGCKPSWEYLDYIIDGFEGHGMKGWASKTRKIRHA